jgi:uncharacterized membrane protein YedE/YeeE
MAIVTAWLAGLVFGIGLIVSGMADPAKVLGFLDLAGAWDPSLALVMGGAIAVGFLPFQWAELRSRTLLGQPMRLPAKSPITPRLAGGSVAFGIGWGLAGFCPGPALVAVGMGLRPALVFVAAMLVGMAVFEIVERLRRRTPPQQRA